MAGHRKKKRRELWSVGAAKRRRENYEERREAAGGKPGWRVAAASNYLQAVLVHTDPVLAIQLADEVIPVLMEAARRAENANLAAAAERSRQARSRKERARDHGRENAA
jgi:hypothetical protein